MNQKDKKVLERFFPEETLPFVIENILKYRLQLKIKPGRDSKYGDYRPPNNQYGYHRISVNNNLKPWHFFLVFLHELSHLITWNKYKRQVKPHGKQWKEEFSSLLKRVAYLNLFPDYMHKHIVAYANDPRNIKATDNQLWRIINQNNDKQLVTVAELQNNSLFFDDNERLFQIKEKRRTRYKCYCITNDRYYLISGNMIINRLGSVADQRKIMYNQKTGK
jgi:hypothetical protein